MSCECGCGQVTPIIPQTVLSRGYVKGARYRFIALHHLRKIHVRGEANVNWKGGRRKKDGYWFIHRPDHPRAGSNGYIREHILLAEAALGHALPSKSQVHHINGDRGINQGNLVICQSEEYHKFLHIRMKAYQATGNTNFRKCWICRHWGDPRQLTSDMSVRITGQAYHRKCNAVYARDGWKIIQTRKG